MANQFVMQQVRRERERQSPVKAAAGNPVQAQTRTVRPVENTTASAAQSIREELAAARRANGLNEISTPPGAPPNRAGGNSLFSKGAQHIHFFLQELRFLRIIPFHTLNSFISSWKILYFSWASSTISRNRKEASALACASCTERAAFSMILLDHS